MMVQDRRGRGTTVLQRATYDLIRAANAEPGLTRVYTMFSANTPQLFVDVDRTRAEMLQVPLENLFRTLEIYLARSS